MEDLKTALTNHLVEKFGKKFGCIKNFFYTYLATSGVQFSSWSDVAKYLIETEKYDSIVSAKIDIEKIYLYYKNEWE